jgi:hypothetical protein
MSEIIITKNDNKTSDARRKASKKFYENNKDKYKENYQINKDELKKSSLENYKKKYEDAEFREKKKAYLREYARKAYQKKKALLLEKV